MKKYALTIVTLALAAAMCITIPVSSDDSDAFDVVTADAGARWDSSTLSTEDIGRLFNDIELKDMARDVLRLIVDSPYVYEITEVVVSDMTISMSTGARVSSDAATYFSADVTSYKVSFKATCDTADTVLLSSSASADLISYVCFANTSQVGAVFEIGAEFTRKDVTIYTEHLTKTNSGDYVVTSEDQKENNSSKTLKADVKYTYTIDAEPAVREFSVNIKLDNSFEGNTKIAFDGKAEEATSSMGVVKTFNVTKAKYAISLENSFNGKTVKNSADMGGTYSAAERYVMTDTAEIRYEGDLDPPQVYFYSNMGEALFYQVNDPSLASNDALKAFLQEHGTIGENYSSALDLAESNLDVGGGGKLLIYAGIGVAVAAVAAVGYFLFVRRKASA